jgi:phage terminase large subunit GpA-like protein
MSEARVGLARELATKSETRSSSLKDVFIEKSDRRKTREESKKGIFARGSSRHHSGMRAVTFQASSARTTHLAERAVAAAERRRASGLIDRCGREGTDVRTRARRLTDAVSDD